MTGHHSTQNEDGAENKRQLVTTLALIFGIVTISMLTPLAPVDVASANETDTPQNISDLAPYYANESTEVGNESWMEGRENATAANMVHYASRFGTFIVGSGTSAPSENPRTAGPLLVGVVLVGAMVGMGIGSGIGSVAGSVLGIAGIYAVIEANVAPTWMYGIMLFALGLVATAVLKQTLR